VRAVVWMRDVEGASAQETDRLLALTPGVQRALLHCGRAHVWTVLAQRLAGDVSREAQSHRGDT
jgi:hypothetical protein